MDMEKLAVTFFGVSEQDFVSNPFQKEISRQDHQHSIMSQQANQKYKVLQNVTIAVFLALFYSKTNHMVIFDV